MRTVLPTGVRIAHPLSLFIGGEWVAPCQAAASRTQTAAQIRESVTVPALVCDSNMAALEADVRLEAVRDLSREALAAQTVDRLVTLKEGGIANPLPNAEKIRLYGGTRPPPQTRWTTQ
jgi:hypothetical protein